MGYGDSNEAQLFTSNSHLQVRIMALENEQMFVSYLKAFYTLYFCPKIRKL